MTTAFFLAQLPFSVTTRHCGTYSTFGVVIWSAVYTDTFCSRFCSINNTNIPAFLYILFTQWNKWVYLSYTRMLICHTNISWSNETKVVCSIKKTRSFGRPDRLPDWQVNRWRLPRCHCHEYCHKNDYAVCICVKSNIL